jgi:hypothetical protein
MLRVRPVARCNTICSTMAAGSPRRANALASGIACLVAAACGGCTVDSGVVEVNWAFVDRDGDPIFPAGQFSVGRGDACGLPGRRASTPVDIDLEVQLDICDPACAGDCEGDCRIVPAERPSCDQARKTLTDVPASSDPYLFFFRAVIVTPQGDCVAPPPDCIAVPGPRQRTVERGLVTDLQVWQLVVDVDTEDANDDALDLEACGCA